jgi:hypothetical protein
VIKKNQYLNSNLLKNSPKEKIKKQTLSIAVLHFAHLIIIFGALALLIVEIVTLLLHIAFEGLR